MSKVNQPEDPTTGRPDPDVDPTTSPDVTPPPKDSPPAVAWLAAHAPEAAPGYAAVLDDLGALADLDAAASYAPGWLADVDAPADVVGTDATGFQPVRALHLSGPTEDPAAAAAACGRNLDALRALARSEALARFLGSVEAVPVPTWRTARPRLGFAPGADRSARPRRGGARDGETAWACGVTGRLFAVPAGAPVPCLYYDNLDADGADPRRAEADPRDRNPDRVVLHPALAAGGPERVLAAMWGALRVRINGLAYAADRALYEAAMIAGLTPDDVPDGEVPRALVRYESAGDGYAEAPAGWRDLGEALG